MPKVDINQELGQSIRNLRMEKNISAASLAKNINKSVGYISNVEHFKTKTIDLEDLYSIFEYLIKDEKERLEKIPQILDSLSIHQTNDEIKQQEWMEVFDKQYRLLPISVTLIDYIKNELTNLNITSIQVMDELNSNRELPPNSKLPYNKLSIKYNENGVSKSIKFKLPTDFLQKILDREVKKTNYINLLGIIYSINLLKGLDADKSYNAAEKALYNCKIYTLIEYRKICQEENINITLTNIAKNKMNGRTKLPPESVKNLNLISDFVEYLKLASDKDINYVNEKLEKFVRSFAETPSITLGLMGIPFYKMKSYDADRQRQLFLDIKELFNKYLEEDNKPELKIEKFD